MHGRRAPRTRRRHRPAARPRRRVRGGQRHRPALLRLPTASRRAPARPRSRSCAATRTATARCATASGTTSRLSPTSSTSRSPAASTSRTASARRRFQIPIHDDGDVETRRDRQARHLRRLPDAPRRSPARAPDDRRRRHDRERPRRAQPARAPRRSGERQPARRAPASSSTRSGASPTASRTRSSHRDPATAAKLRTIADQPETKRFGSWTPNPKHEIATFLQRAQATDPGAIPLISTYRLKHLAVRARAATRPPRSTPTSAGIRSSRRGSATTPSSSSTRSTR